MTADEARKETKKVLEEVNQEELERELDLVIQKAKLAIQCKETCVIHKLTQTPTQQAVLANLRKLGYTTNVIRILNEKEPYILIGWRYER